MADITGLDENGQPTSVPQEAAGEAFKSGKLQFNPTDRVPVILNGIVGTMPAGEALQAVQAGDAEPNFDPHGTRKAAVAGAARGLTMGGSDWAAIEGTRLLHGNDAADNVRQTLQGLRDEHPAASTLGEIGGAVLPSMVPGGAEAEAEQVAGRGAEAARTFSAADQLITGEQAAQEADSALQAAQGQFQAISQADAAKGTLQGSVLAKTLRAANPFEYVGRGGQLVGNALTSALGGGRLAEFTGSMGRFATEGALIGAANAVDESELGDTSLTGETLFASMEHGALWGSALGLVGTGVGKIFTSAARLSGNLSDKLAQAQLGASPAEQKIWQRRFGAGSLGRLALENGYSPLMSGEQQYQWAQELANTKGEQLGRAVTDAEQYGGVSGVDVLKAVEVSTAKPVADYEFLGDAAPAVRTRLIDEVKSEIGWVNEPSPPPTLTPADLETRIDAEMRTQKIKPPVYPSRAAVEKYAQALMKEKLQTPVSAKDVQKFLLETIEGARHSGADIREQLTDPIKFIRENQRASTFHEAREALQAQYGSQKKAYDNLRGLVAQHFNEVAAHQRFEYEHALNAAREHNAGIRVGFTQLRGLRRRIDDVIPWNYVNAMDAPTRAAQDVKVAARSAIEGRVEQGFDEAAANARDPAIKGRYLHAKQGYAMAKELMKGAERARAREASLFGRPSRVGVGGMLGHMTLGAAAAITGHPFAGFAIAGRGMTEHYGPKFAAWALHKASSMAKLKAVQQDVLIGVRRGVRAAIEQGSEKNFARVAIKDMTPQEARMTAAEAMAHVAKLAGNTAELRSRLAALDPNLPILAPQSFNAAEGAFRRAVLYLANKIPGRLLHQMQLDGQINPKDMTDAEARDFLDHTAAVVDPRVATDALASGTVTSNQAQALKAVYPAIVNNGRATLARMSAMNRETLDYIPTHKKASLTELFGDPDPSFTMALQTNAQMLSSAQMAVGGSGGRPKGMTHAAATSKGMGLSVQLMQTESQAAEAGPPGRRGRKSSAQ